MIIHTVKRGETVTSISELYSVPVSRIIDNNSIDPLKLTEGQTLVIQNNVLVHSVMPNETLKGISRRYGVSVRNLLRYNPSLDPDKTIYPGQTIIIKQFDMPKYKIKTSAYVYPFVNKETLKKTLPYLSYVIPFTYGFKPNGELIAPDDIPIIDLAAKYGTSSVMHISTLTEKGNFSNELSTLLFNDKDAQSVLISQVLMTLSKKGYSGISVDFEYVKQDEAAEYADFISNLRTAANNEGYFLSVALAPKTYAAQPGLLYEAHDYSLLGKAANENFLMTYEWGYAYGPPLAISPYPNVRRVVDYAVSEIDPGQILLGLPNYAYDWTLPYIRGEGRAQTITNADALYRAQLYRSDIQFDESAKAPYFYYTDRQGRAHVVWFNDARTYYALSSLINEYGLIGSEIWNGMSFDPQLWLTLNSFFEISDI